MSDEADDDTATDYVVVETTAIPQLSEVRFYDETKEHIAEGHPEFRTWIPSLEHAVTDTVANPTAVYRSRTLPETSVVYESLNNTFEGNPCTVPVRIIADSTSGRVTTAMFKKGKHGDMLWSGDDDETS
jgi:hypothetical protein